MSTEITREPKPCPSCGEENPPTASHCILCGVPLDGAVQTVPRPGVADFHLPPVPDDLLVRQPSLYGWKAIAVWVGAALFIPASGVVAFFTVCNTIADPHAGEPGGDLVSGCMGLFWGVFAGVVVPVALAVAFYLWRRRR